MKKFQKTLILALWGNRSTTQTHIWNCRVFFSILEHCYTTHCATRRKSVSWQPWDFTKNQHFRKIRISFRLKNTYDMFWRRSYSPFNKRLTDVNKQIFCNMYACVWLMSKEKNRNLNGSTFWKGQLAGQITAPIIGGFDKERKYYQQKSEKNSWNQFSHKYVCMIDVIKEKTEKNFWMDPLFQKGNWRDK